MFGPASFYRRMALTERLGKVQWLENIEGTLVFCRPAGSGPKRIHSLHRRAEQEGVLKATGKLLRVDPAVILRGEWRKHRGGRRRAP